MTYPATPHAKPGSAPIRRTYIDSREGQIHLRMAGDPNSKKRPMICFHLSPSSGIVYDTWLGEMGKDRLIVAPDTPGYGMSDFPSEQPTIATFAKAMTDVIDALNIKEADVMGYHTGSKTCVELAQQQPDRIKHLVLISTPIYTAEDLVKQNDEMGSPDTPVADGTHLLHSWAGLWRWRGPEHTPADIMHAFPDHIKGGERKHWGHAAAFSYTYPENIPAVKQPILIINTNDDLVKYTRRIAPHLTNGKIIELMDWGHGFLDYHPEETSAFVRPFLDSDAWPDAAK
ncbi:MAG: alpha/beta hydrolase [Rhodospirillaceae bacterium]|nr:alpha/beta hydrolase [Rhodospirillaceae bacterium]